MKRLTVLLALVLVIALVVPALAKPTEKGNGAPKTQLLYNLQILGKDTCPGDDMKGTNRHTIMVYLNYDDGSQNGQSYSTLDRTNKIFLAQGDFQVVDGNACDGDGARFQLPANPYTCPVGDPQCLNTDPDFQAYTVWIRGLGKPGPDDLNDPDAKYAKITTCAVDDMDTVDTADDTIRCSTEIVTVKRTKGKSTFSNVTKQLTTLCLDTDLNGSCDTRVGIFSDDYYDYFWDYDNHGLRHAQMQFYAIPD